MINIIDDTFENIVFTKYTYARSADSTTLYQLSKSQNKLQIDNIDEAIDYVYQEKYKLTLFIGSLYLVSEVRSKILK